ncbi:hypothetical protein BABINDRAFT_165025 [Babjeviella inositovora NRRL Y-12698]|uniref:Phosphatidylinositol N-acetylglucosaminyltransferase subunit H conserved domain-containing protein n=1 Tax=Babjeviella inositovora NRRL Y-12698 TaxID=984486 RepID=A0A1E3QUZ1_9ASCO|nr:uncharacterized protein BABINDRAFT_165025 [Babjeviella inositovora NRRL Y-12698]ODQ81475.1 hypothetical protein BABINDRAFT_165025 [Babjeviella inositovora NRRL Y-12698]
MISSKATQVKVQIPVKSSYKNYDLFVIPPIEGLTPAESQATEVIKFTVQSAKSATRCILLWFFRITSLVACITLTGSYALYKGVEVSPLPYTLTWLSLQVEQTARPDVTFLLLIGASLYTLVSLVRIPVQSVESILVMRDIGVQLFSHSGTKFIPSRTILDVLLMESFQGFGVIYTLCVLVDDGKSAKLEVVFPSMLPRLPQLEVVWKHTRKCLLGDRPGFGRKLKTDGHK